LGLTLLWLLLRLLMAGTTSASASSSSCNWESGLQSSQCSGTRSGMVTNSTSWWFWRNGSLLVGLCRLGLAVLLDDCGRTQHILRLSRLRWLGLRSLLTLYCCKRVCCLLLLS
jgi:hypothetical protein